MTVYEVIVGNIGTVYYGNDGGAAQTWFNEYRNQSDAHYGRAAGEDVTLLKDREPIQEHFGDGDQNTNIEVGINILKRVIEYLSCSLPMAEKSQQDALDIANCAIEELFTLAGRNSIDRY